MSKKIEIEIPEEVQMKHDEIEGWFNILNEIMAFGIESNLEPDFAMDLFKLGVSTHDFEFIKMNAISKSPGFQESSEKKNEDSDHEEAH